ncbi:MAG: hypothetical protein ACJ71W_06605 [Terriglobales bacterium]
MSDILLAVCIAITQLLLVLLGIFLTLRTANKPHGPWVLLVLLVGFAGIVLIGLATFRTVQFQSAANANILDARLAAQQAWNETLKARLEQQQAQQKLRKRLDQVATDTQTSFTKSQADTQSAVHRMLHPPRKLSRDQRNAIIQILQRSGTYEVMIHASESKESKDFARDLTATLQAAGWKVRQIEWNTPEVLFGLLVVVNNSHKTPASAIQLSAALQYARLKFESTQVTKIPEGACMLIVALNDSSDN